MCIQAFLPMALAVCVYIGGPSWCDEDISERPSSLQQKRRPYVQRSFAAEDRLYVAELWEGMRLRIYEDHDHDRVCIFEYEVRDYNPTTGPELLIAPNPEQTGRHGFAWKYCESHNCPYRNGAIFFDVLEKTLFTLAYEEDSWNATRGITLSSNLAEPRNRKVKDWLLKWWQEWPGDPDISKIPISYAPGPPR